MASVTILSDNGATSGSAGLKTSGGNDGVLLLQTTTSGGTPTTAITIDNTQTVTFTNQPTYTGGTANGVLYLNGSKAVTSGTALVFDGTNLGLGVTPSAWGSNARVVQVAGGGSVFGQTNANILTIGDNMYWDNTNFKYIATDYASKYVQYQSQHLWFTAASGTAGDAITFTQAMTLDSNGKLLVGTTSSGSARLYVRGSGTTSSTASFEASNSSGATRLYVQDDGTTRFFGSSGSETARIDTNGNFGIGETAPASTLVVRKDTLAGVGGEITILNYASGGTIGNAAQLNFGLENSTYSGDLGNAQIKAIVTAVNNSSDLVYSMYNGTAFAERFRMAATGVFTSTGTSMANSLSNATAITVATATPTAVASTAITTKGKSIMIIATGDGNPNQTGGWHYAQIYRDSTAIGKYIISENAGGTSCNCPFAVCTIDTPAAGTYTYSLRVWQGFGSFTYGETGDGQAPSIWAVEVM